MKKFLVNLVHRIILWKKTQDFKAAVRKANYLQNKTFKIHLVFKMEGKFVVITKQDVRQLYQRGAFKRGMKLNDVYTAALYRTQL